MEYITIDLDTLSDDEHGETCAAELTKHSPRSSVRCRSKGSERCSLASVSQTISEHSGSQSTEYKQVTFGDVQVEYFQQGSDGVGPYVHDAVAMASMRMVGSGMDSRRKQVPGPPALSRLTMPQFMPRLTSPPATSSRSSLAALSGSPFKLDL
eukprot:907426-Amphidinium_carterae.1